MRRIAANYIYPVTQEPIKNGIVEVDESGKILNIIDSKGEFRESRNLEFYNGVIVPGFVNSHSHLELSEHKNKLSQGEKLHNFLEAVFNLKKQDTNDLTYKSIELYDDLMQRAGIVAVGDVCNTNKTIQQKVKSKILYYNFIEAIGLGDAEMILEKNIDLKKEFSKQNLISAIVPHAPYSVSNPLFMLIKNVAEKDNSVLSIHNQETQAEDEMFKTKSGKLIEKLIDLGVDYSNWQATGKSSLESLIGFLPSENNILFVHNTYSTKKDLEVLTSGFKNAYLCLCPKSNLYIENKLPDISLFFKYSDKVVIGTDSLASNNTLSVLEEMKVLSKNFSEIIFNQLLQWATINGAKALKFDNKIGSIEVGKTPGLNLITDFDFAKMMIKEESAVKVLA